MEEAAIKMSRILLNARWRFVSGGAIVESVTKNQIRSVYLDCLIEGTALSDDGSREQQERKIIDSARAEELAKIGREEARAEQAAKKAAKASVKK